MEKNALKAILACVQGAEDVVKHLVWENYPYGEAADADLYDIFYQLNSIAIKIYSKVKELEAGNNEQKES